MGTTKSKYPYGRTIASCMVLLALLFVSQRSTAQATVVNAILNTFNVTSHSVFEVNISNSGGKPLQVILQSTIYNAAGQVVCQGKTNPFTIKGGFNPSASLNFQVAEFSYGSAGQANYVKTSHILPAGNYRYCVELMVLGGNVEPSDQVCDDVQSESFSFLNLVTPYDKDTVNSEYPLLIWTHSDPFSALAPGDFFRIVVTRMNDRQNAEEALQVNQPLFIKDYLTTHQVQYPIDATELKPGEKYAWEIEEISGNVVVKKSEAWEFVMPEPHNPSYNRYAVLKKTLDAGFYTAIGDKVFFCFQEEYGGKILSCNIYDDNGKPVEPKTINEKNKETNAPALNVKESGYNRFEIDLETLNVKKGFYRLEVLNEKKEKF